MRCAVYSWTCLQEKGRAEAKELRHKPPEKRPNHSADTACRALGRRAIKVPAPSCSMQAAAQGGHSLIPPSIPTMRPLMCDGIAAAQNACRATPATACPAPAETRASITTPTAGAHA
jgi:hypothetical protein